MNAGPGLFWGGRGDAVAGFSRLQNGDGSVKIIRQEGGGFVKACELFWVGLTQIVDKFGNQLKSDAAALGFVKKVWCPRKVLTDGFQACGGPVPEVEMAVLCAGVSGGAKEGVVARHGQFLSRHTNALKKRAERGQRGVGGECEGACAAQDNGSGVLAQVLDDDAGRREHQHLFFWDGCVCEPEQGEGVRGHIKRICAVSLEYSFLRAKGYGRLGVCSTRLPPRIVLDFGGAAWIGEMG